MNQASSENNYDVTATEVDVFGDANSNVSENDNFMERILLWSFGSYEDPGGVIALHVILNGIVMPIIAAFGLVANSLNAAVLTRVIRHNKSSPTYCILLAMTVADFLIAAWSLLGSALFYMRSDPVISDVYVYRLSGSERTFYTSRGTSMNVFAFISNWCTTAVAAVRFVAVYYPLKSQQWCTRRRTSVAIVLTSVIAVLLMVPPHVVSSNKSGDSANGSLPVPQVYYIAIVIVTDALPWTLCVVLVSLLLASLRQRSRSSSVSSLNGKREHDKQRMLTATLVSTAVWFIVTTAPSTVSAIISYWNDYAEGSTVPLTRLSDVGQLLALINFAGNVFFYSLINKTHRKQLKVLMCIVNLRRRRPSIRATYSSKHSSSTKVATVTPM